MKTTKWISDKLKSINSELEFLENQIKERVIPEYEYNETTFFHRNGKPSSMTINEMLTSLVAKKMILTEILQ